MKKYLLYSKSLAPSFKGELRRSVKDLTEELGARSSTTMFAEYAEYSIVSAKNRRSVTHLPVEKKVNMYLLLKKNGCHIYVFYSNKMCQK